MDTLCLQTGVHGISASIPMSGGHDLRTNPSQVSAVGRSVGPSNAIPVDKSSQHKPVPFSSRLSFTYPLKYLWPGGRKRYDAIAIDDAVVVEKAEKNVEEEGTETKLMETEGQSENWVLKILHVRSLWAKEQGKSGGGEERVNGEEMNGNEIGSRGDDDDDEECDVCRVDEEEDQVQFDRDSFSKLLRRVSLAEAKLYAQMSYLGHLAYSIPKIKKEKLLKYHRLRFVTSSVEKIEKLAKIEKEVREAEDKPREVVEDIKPKDVVEDNEQKSNGYRISASAAYQIAASAAFYLHSHTKSILPFKSSKRESSEDSPEGDVGRNDSADIMNSDMASFMATTDSVTAVVAAKEEVKQAVADDLNSTRSSPCGWFICDDELSGTRYFVIQGSESLASWQANLLFEPIQFEGLDVPVHRGIYEAAKGIYEQMLPEVHAHLKAHGGRATFRFTGHSLGGSLSLLVNLMLLIRGEVPISSLLPVVTFGSPSIMCGGDNLLRKLGLPRNHVQAITLHRDIVPRAFSCNYPNHVAEILKAVNGNFRNHTCLNNQKLLYAPMGELLILQPEEKFSPHHDLLPSGCGLYLLTCSVSDGAENLLRAAKTVFLNSPHPLEILRDRAAYGSEGIILRDHDMNSYLKSVRDVIRQELNYIRKAKREQRRKVWWPLVTPRGIHSGFMVASNDMGQNQLNISGILQTGWESLKRIGLLVASQRMHLLVVLLFPARMLLLGTYSMLFR